MIDPTWAKLSITDFGGSWTAIDPTEVPPNRALVSQNCEFIQGQVATRKGFGTAFAAAEQAVSLFNWQSSLGNYAVWFLPGTGVRAIKVSDNPPIKATLATIATAGVVGASFAPSGPRLYVAPFNSAGSAVGAAYVISYQSAAFVADTLFKPPMTYVPAAPTEPGAGLVTAGTHRIGYLVEHRNGFIGRPSPDSGAGTPSVETFTPVSFTATGAKNASIVLNPTTWPASASKVHLVMTPVVNPNLYSFVPGANATVIGGASDSKTITWSISDEDLVNTGIDASDNLFFMTQTTAGVAPTQPSVLIPYGDRMVYVTTTTDVLGNSIGCVYISNRNNYQQITPDRHLIMLPGQLGIVTGFVLRGILYLLGPSWTFSTHDTGEYPTEWPLPQLVDSRRGTNAPRGVALSPTGNYAWVANEGGLWLFDGTGYPQLPISYFNSDWSRINWTYAAQVQVLDDPAARRVFVLAPLDAATTPSHLLVFDYTRGMSHDKVFFSLDTVGGSYALGSMALIQNDLTGSAAANTKHSELWLGSSGSGSLLRRMTSADTAPYRDVAAAIPWVWESGLLPVQQAYQLVRHHGGFVRATGAGTLSITAKHVDGSWSQALASMILSATPGQAPLRSMYRVGERVSVRFTTNAVDAHCVLSEYSHYYSPFALNR